MYTFIPSRYTFVLSVMIKRILVALDVDSDTPTATKYAIDIAKRTGARLTGLAVVDMGGIESTSRGGGIGSMYYMEKLRDKLTEETREKARSLLASFRKTVDAAGCEHVETVAEGVPFQRIVEDMKYHDLLVIGKDPHFFYAHPKHDTNTLAHVIESTIGPTLVIPKSYRPVKKVLFATDGGNPSARALRRFIHLAPFGPDVELTVLHVDDENPTDSDLYLTLAKDYLSAHGFDAKVLRMQEKDVDACILKQAEVLGVDLIVSGVKTKRSFRSLHLGKSTEHLLKGASVAVFIDH